MSERVPCGKYLPFRNWPPIDVAAWETAIADGDIFDGRGPAAHWATATRGINLEHYSRWLGFLLQSGALEEYETPQARVTPQNVRTFITHLQSSVAPRTVVSALVGLKVMMKAMAPSDNWRWLADVCNYLGRSSEPRTEKRSRMRPTGEIYASALGELDRLIGTSLGSRIERVAYRDALMLALLAARPLRRKNFAGLRINEHLIYQRDHWLLRIPGEEVKNKQPLEFDLPESIVPYLDLYLSRVRPSFLKSGACQSLWLTFEGGALSDHAIYGRIVLTTKRLLGVAIWPHLLRDCAATSLSTESPSAALSAAQLLGHRNYATTERHYIRANQLDAGRKVAQVLKALRTERSAT